ncbi:MAG TPA: TraB/GumN family protein, partial [Candidatus Tumulicola sp.]
MNFGRIFVLLTAALFLCGYGSALAAPALWLVKGPVGTVYLFGTVHVLRDGVQWRSPELESAIDASQDLYLEIADPGNFSQAAKAFLKLGVDNDHLLSTKISKADMRELDALLQRYHLGTDEVFERFQPWLVYVMLDGAPILHSNYSAANGVDLQVRKRFVDAGKPVRGFETIDSQVRIFADMPQPAQVAMLDSQLQDLTKSPAPQGSLDAIVSAWLTGDQDSLASSLQFASLEKTAISQRLLTDRNSAFADAIAKRLQQPGTSFVSVGAAHMLGADGVPALLRAMGFTVTRVAIAQTEPPISPSPIAGATPSSDASPAPTVSTSPVASASPVATSSPVPATLTAPQGWTSRKTTLASGPFKADRMWNDPKGGGVLMTGHITLPDVTTVDLDSLD